MFHMSREIYEKIEELAKLITESEEYQKMKTAEQLASQDPSLSAKEDAYMQTRQQLEAELSKEDKDFDRIGALTYELDDISEAMHRLPMYMLRQQTRQDFAALMNGVSDVLQNIVEPDIQCSCSGNCSNCGGCQA